ncbi:MAG: hydrogenase maturation protein [Aquificaceae bacterium]
MPTIGTEDKMKVLLLCHRFNSLSQRIYCELSEAGYEVSVELDVHPHLTIEAAKLYKPDLIIAPFLKRKIPREVWENYTTLVVHPGPPGDRGPDAIDWAILKGEKNWGVCILSAVDEYDAGDIWSYRIFSMRKARKSSLYRREITEGIVEALWEALEKIKGGVKGTPQKEGRFNPKVPLELRRIDWFRNSTEDILRKVYAGDGQPGAIASIEGQEYYLFNAYSEAYLRGKPGELIARRDDAVCIGTLDSALWITHMRKREKYSIKLPALKVLPMEVVERLKEEAIKPWESIDLPTYREIVYREERGIALIEFNFYNGAMSTEQCERLLQVVRYAKERPVKALVFLGGEDFFSNGMNLNTIEASHSPADESWRNIKAMDELCEEILTTLDRLTVAGIRGNAGAGGVFLALTCDLVFAREGVVLNPHYKNIGNLYGSEFWTYTLPKRVGWEKGREIMENRMPISSKKALEMGLLDGIFCKDPEEFLEKLKSLLVSFINSKDFEDFIDQKRKERLKDWSIKPLKAYLEEELERIRLNFYGFDPSYHIARYYFVRRYPPFRTPPYLALHRRLGFQSSP